MSQSDDDNEDTTSERQAAFSASDDEDDGSTTDYANNSGVVGLKSIRARTPTMSLAVSSSMEEVATLENKSQVAQLKLEKLISDIDTPKNVLDTVIHHIVETPVFASTFRQLYGIERTPPCVALMTALARATKEGKLSLLEDADKPLSRTVNILFCTRDATPPFPEMAKHRLVYRSNESYLALQYTIRSSNNNMLCIPTLLLLIQHAANDSSIRDLTVLLFIIANAEDSKTRKPTHTAISIKDYNRLAETTKFVPNLKQQFDKFGSSSSPRYHVFLNFEFVKESRDEFIKSILLSMEDEQNKLEGIDLKPITVPNIDQTRKRRSTTRQKWSTPAVKRMAAEARQHADRRVVGRANHPVPVVALDT